MVAQRVVIDPVVRTHGQLRVELEVDNHRIVNAWSEATQFRGIEQVVAGRDPRDAWAFVARICGACAGTHSIASVTAVENALGAAPPPQAQRIRDIVVVSQAVHDHVMHFYHSHLFDWVNVAAALDADPVKAVEFARTIGSRWKGNTEVRFAQVREQLRQVWASGKLGVFTGDFWDHPDYRLPLEANLMAVSHYLDSLEFQRSISRIVTVFGGKNPHPNFLVGGMACSLDPDKSETINRTQLDQVNWWADQAAEFVHDCFYPDVLALMSTYREYFHIGASWPNFAAAGLVGARFSGPLDRQVSSGTSAVQPAVLLDGDLVRWHPLDPQRIEEFVSSAWYSYTGGDDTGLSPAAGETTVQYSGPQPPFSWLGDAGKYTWSKAPRYDARPTQVGPIARVLSAFAQGHQKTVSLVNDALDRVDVDTQRLNSTAGRTLARGIEAVTAVDTLVLELLPALTTALQRGDFDVFDASRWEPSSWPGRAAGVCLMEASRGLVGHWLGVGGGTISTYQVVSPGTWLVGGRDPRGLRGPLEEALAGHGAHPLRDPQQPLEPLRTLHSFDPCMPCAVHMLRPDEHAHIQVVNP